MVVAFPNVKSDPGKVRPFGSVWYNLRMGRKKQTKLQKFLKDIKKKDLYKKVSGRPYLYGGVAAALALLAFFIIRSNSGTITVIGNFQDVEPNKVATFTATINEENEDKEMAINALDKKSQSLKDEITAFGIDPLYIKTVNNSVYQRDEIEPLRNTQVSRKVWVATTSLEIELRDIQKAGELSALINSQDSVEAFGPMYSLDPNAVDETRLMANAIEDAEEKARFIARSLNKNVGKIISVEEVTANSVYGYDNILSSSTESTVGEFNPGSSRISKTVRVTFEFK